MAQTVYIRMDNCDVQVDEYETTYRNCEWRNRQKQG